MASVNWDHVRNAILESPSLKRLNIEDLWLYITRAEATDLVQRRPGLRILWQDNEILYVNPSKNVV
jgi:hypothetical protein